MNRHVCKHVIVLMLVLMTLAVTIYAWFIYMKTTPLGTFSIGNLVVQVNTEGGQFIDANLETLLHIDFQKDVMTNQTGMFDEIATSLFFEININEDAFPVRNTIRLTFPENQDPLFYLVIFEALNPEATHEDTSSYHSLISTLYDPLSDDESFLRVAIDLYNQSVLDAISAIEMNPGDTLRIQLVFWGDYNELQAPDDYLERTYMLGIEIETYQSNRE